MKQGLFTILEQTEVARDVHRMVLEGDTSAITAPGQFVNIAIEGLYLRRPISVCAVDGDRLTLIFKVVGAGTRAMSKMKPRQTLDVLTGLGNGYDLQKSGETPLLIGGGVGVPPLYELARRLIAQGKKVSAIIGFNAADEVFYADELKALGAAVQVTTVDGSVGVKGFVTDALKNVPAYSYVYTCGPEPMLRAVYGAIQTSGQFSFEERMGCGFGACMGCTCETKYGHKRICRDGPVLEKEEIVW